MARMATMGGRRRGRALAVAAAVVVAGLGAGAWAVSGSGSAPDAQAGGEPGEAGDARAAGPDDPTLGSPGARSPGTTGPATTGSSTTAVALPVPEPVPADEYAPTPEVILGTLSLPTLGVSAPLGEGVTLTAVDRGPGHWPGTAMPGQVGNVVVAGHRVTNTRPFHDLDKLVDGAALVFTMNDGTTWSYEHIGTTIVDSDALYIVDQTPARTATLFACHPKGSDAQRIVARFRLVGPGPVS